MGTNSFSNSVDLLHRAMDVASLRYQVTANNLAMSEVPNYKKQYVNFESELKRAFESRDNSHNAFRMETTHPDHVRSEQPRNWRNVEPRRVTDYLTTAKANGNNVDAEEEAMNIVQIQMQYRLLAQLASFEFNQVNTAMRELR
ncbi:MAG: flagellar basal body rod protein FlgB [Treponema sp.]|nr:flagellar basal body rod protein FlgB [Treponema sp.]